MKVKNPCELQHYMRAKNWLCCVMSTENVMSLSKSLRAVSLMEASTGRLRLSNYWNRSTLTPHPTDWPTQTSKDFHLGTCILMGGNWSPGQSIGIARLLFDRFSYLHIPLSYTTFRCRLAIKQLTFFNLLHSTQLHIVQHKIYFSCYITFWFGAKENSARNA